MHQSAHDSEQARILVLAYGGTWGMTQNSGGELQPSGQGRQYDLTADFPALSAFCKPMFKELAAVDSSDMCLRDYGRIADSIIEHAEEADGFVVVQGTDTLEFAAPALAFATAGFHKPIMVTGAQLPKSAPGSDAENNIVNACRVASLRVRRRGHMGPAVPEVAVVFGSRIIRGTQCRKYSERDLEAFDTVNAPLLGRIQLQVGLNGDAIRYDADQSMSPPTEPAAFDEDVSVVSLHPSLKPEILEAVGDRSSGVILSAYGAGNIPCAKTRKANPYALEDAIRVLVQEDVPVGITTRCVVGAAEMGSYENGSAAQEAGAMILNDMTTETAYVKLAWVLANQDRWPKHARRALRGGPGFIGGVRKAMLEPIAGEISRNDEIYSLS
jgi:L-asparaginase